MSGALRCCCCFADLQGAAPRIHGKFTWLFCNNFPCGSPLPWAACRKQVGWLRVYVCLWQQGCCQKKIVFEG